MEEEEEECNYDCILIDGSNAQGTDKKNYSIGEDNSNMCKVLAYSPHPYLRLSSGGCLKTDI